MDLIEKTQELSPVDVALYVSSLGRDTGGGIVRNTLRVSHALAQRGYSVTIVVAGDRGRPFADLPHGVRLVNLRAKNAITSLLPLVRYLHSARPAVLISARSLANCIAVIAVRMTKDAAKLILTERTSIATATRERTGLIYKIMPFLMRLTYRHADVVVAVSHGVALSLSKTIRYPLNKIEVIYNPIVDNNLYVSANKYCSHRWLQRDELPVIIAVGRLSPEKGFDTLLRAFAIMRARVPSRLVILGEGACRGELERLCGVLAINDAVDLPGFAPNPYPYMHAASVFVLSSRYEGLPTALIEAMACGVPIVTTDCPSGPSEILENGKWGRLVPVDDAGAMADAISDTIQATTHPDVKSRAAFFSAKRAVDHYLQLTGLLPRGPS